MTNDIEEAEVPEPRKVNPDLIIIDEAIGRWLMVIEEDPDEWQPGAAEILREMLNLTKDLHGKGDRKSVLGNLYLYQG